MREGFLCVLLLFILSCEKQVTNNHLPVPTCEGKHELGFFVNHETWVPFDTDRYKEHELPKVKFDDGLIRISATRVDEANYSRNWFCLETVNPNLESGAFPVKNETCKAVYQTYYYGPNKDKTSEIYTLKPNEKNLINFTCIDTVANIIAGTFELTAQNELGETLSFTSGRFDLLLEK